MFDPYFISGTTVYMTDGAVEVDIEVFDSYGTAELVSKLLNECYKAAYQDGLNASLRKEHKDLLEKLTGLTIENLKLKRKLGIEQLEREE